MLYGAASVIIIISSFIIIIIKNECHSNIIVNRLQGCGHSKKLKDFGKLFHTRDTASCHRWSRVRCEEHRAWPMTTNSDAAGNQRCSTGVAGR